MRPAGEAGPAALLRGPRGAGGARPSGSSSAAYFRGAGKERRRGLPRVSSWARGKSENRRLRPAEALVLGVWERLGGLRAALPGSRAEESEAREVRLPEQPRILSETRLRELKARRNRNAVVGVRISWALLGPLKFARPAPGVEEPVVMERVVNQCPPAASDTPTTGGRRSSLWERGRATCCLVFPTSGVVCTCLMHAESFVGA